LKDVPVVGQRVAVVNFELSVVHPVQQHVHAGAAPGKIEAHLADYRADIVDVDGRVVRAIDLVCPNDEIAKEHARSLVDGHDVELWRGARHIEKFKHKPLKRGG
jgi:hypothetical protein